MEEYMTTQRKCEEVARINQNLKCQVSNLEAKKIDLEKIVFVCITGKTGDILKDKKLSEVRIGTYKEN